MNIIQDLFGKSPFGPLVEHTKKVHECVEMLKPLMEGDVPVQHFHEADMLVVGDPERCFEKMKHYADLGVDQLICYVQFGYHAHESVMKTIELLGKEVLPELEGYTPSIKS